MNPTIRLHIATPCTQTWDQMTPDTKGRFCGSCQKTVVDFTAMDDRELLQWFANRRQSTSQHESATPDEPTTFHDNVCGRLRTDQANRPLTAPKEQKGRWRYWNYLIAGLLFSSEAVSQTKPANPPSSQYQPASPTSGHLIGDTVIEKPKPFPTDSVRGRVVDSLGRPVSYASVIYSPKGGGVMADEHGYFTIPAHKVSRYQQLAITAVGYQGVNITVDKLLTEHQVMVPQTITLKDVVVGGMVVVTKRRRRRIPAETVSLFKDTLALVGLTKPALAVYPNPVARGAAITISARLDHEGKYSLQLYSSSGEVIETREIERAAADNKQELPIPAGLVPGVYFVKLSHPAMTKWYSQQIVVY